MKANTTTTTTSQFNGFRKDTKRLNIDYAKNNRVFLFVYTYQRHWNVNY